MGQTRLICRLDHPGVAKEATGAGEANDANCGMIAEAQAFKRACMEESMSAHLAYLGYVLTHKWYVFLACLRLGVPIHQAIIHDWVKFLPVEWGPYVRQFYNADGSRRQVRDATGAYDPSTQSDDFRRAWLHHQRQPHHWQAWCVVGDGGACAPLRIPARFAREMVADWIGAARANGAGARPHTEAWYLAHKDRMVLHDSSHDLVTQIMHEARRKGLIT